MEVTLEGITYDLKLDANDTYLKMANSIINSKNVFATLDNFLLPMITRVMKINEGFIAMMESNNETCAMPLVRIQLSNLTILYAGLDTDDYDYFYRRLIKGEKLAGLKDRNDKSYNDTRIINIINERFPMLKTIWETSNKFVHPSEFLTNSFIKITWNEETDLPVSIERKGYKDSWYSDTEKSQMYISMACVNEAIISYLEEWMRWRDEWEEEAKSTTTAVGVEEEELNIVLNKIRKNLKPISEGVRIFGERGSNEK
ncbi:MAG: hypothetical protein KBT29_12250 [Prevotellaceae bacterium]|nr:hypothetical protein [Candidatus Minthosoma caballi]